MSLINDALKQTKQTRQQGPPANPPPLSPVEPAAPEGLGWLLPGIVVLLLVVAGVIVGLSLFKPVPLTASAMPAHHQVPGAVSAEPTPKVKMDATAPLTATHTASSTNSIAAVPPKPPEPQLQGILFTATRPCAIVSGKTVFVGDFVGKFRVAAILKDSVTLQDETQTKVLSLNPQ